MALLGGGRVGKSLIGLGLKVLTRFENARIMISLRE